MHMFDSQAKLGVILIFYKICVLVNFYKLQSTFVIDGLRLRYLRDKVGNRPVNMHIDQTSGQYWF